MSTIEKDLKLNYPKLTDFERLSLAIQIQRNQILSAGFVVNSSSPNGLEAIGIALGYSNNSFSGNINERLSEITAALEDIKVNN
ncbi:hypothetical protein ACFSR2_03685 [Emticicia soli]|uniref:Uncharacterized protein n=1 Tax=Emticicia soli TaxID=2027878 RepID=A0ABW5J1W3_9BACT